jgi:tetratricopeptide (TPR) repeat protein
VGRIELCVEGGFGPGATPALGARQPPRAIAISNGATRGASGIGTPETLAFAAAAGASPVTGARAAALTGPIAGTKPVPMAWVRRFAGAFLLLLAGQPACVERGTEHRIRANALFKLGDYHGALAECRAGLERRPKDASLWVLEGKTAFELGELHEARAAYQRAVSEGQGRRDVFLGDAYLGLAVIATREQDWDGARQQFLHLLELNPTDGSSHANLAKVDLRLGNIDEAVEHAEAASRSRGNDEQVLFTLGKVYLAAGKPDEAEKTFSHICEIIPTSASCPYGLALVALQKGDPTGALAKLSEAVDRKIPHPDTLSDDPALAPLQHNPDFVALAGRAASAR